MNIRKNIATVFIAAAQSFSSSACVYSSNTQVEHLGNYVDDHDLARVRPGTSAAAVVGLLGEPTHRQSSTTGSELWTWEYVEQETDDTSVLLLFSSENVEEHSGQVFVELRDGAVIRAWRG